MGLLGKGTETFLYINGLAISREIQLRENVLICPIKSSLNIDDISDKLTNDVDFSIVLLSKRNIASQLKITASDSKSLVISAWNAQWDCILLGALFNCDVMFNIQSDKSIEEADKASYINVSNYGLHALFSKIYEITDLDTEWINNHYNTAHSLLEKEPFKNAVHAMASYRWHSLPRVQLAIIWSGIEALFKIESEISFRSSLYIANFLSDKEPASAKEYFHKIKKLYNSRSASVHGGRIKKDVNELVSESAQILNSLIKKCAETGDLPDVEQLVF